MIHYTRPNSTLFYYRKFLTGVIKTNSEIKPDHLGSRTSAIYITYVSKSSSNKPIIT